MCRTGQEKRGACLCLQVEVTELARQPQEPEGETMGVQNWQRKKRCISFFISKSDWASQRAKKVQIERQWVCRTGQERRNASFFSGNRSDWASQPGTRTRERDNGCAELAKGEKVHFSLYK